MGMAGLRSIQPLPLPLALLLACLASLAAPFCLSGCGRSAAPAAESKPLYLVASGDTAGWLMPCGCTSNQSGGLLRRATYVNGLRASSDVILADVGGAAGGDSEYHKVKFEAILAGEQQMGIAAHNIGRSEAALGPD